MNTRFRAIAGIALVAVLASGYADSSCKEGKPKPTSTKKDKPQEPKPFPGNVSITFWVGAKHPVDVIWSVAGVSHTHSCDKSCHWDATGKPEQAVLVAVGHRNKKQEDLLDVEVTQNNNGRIICKDSNIDRDPIDPVGCKGTIKI